MLKEFGPPSIFPYIFIIASQPKFFPLYMVPLRLIRRALVAVSTVGGPLSLIQLTSIIQVNYTVWHLKPSNYTYNFTLILLHFALTALMRSLTDYSCSVYV